MSVRLEPPPEALPPEPEPRKRKPEKKIRQVEVELPAPLADAPRPKIVLSKPKAAPKAEPEPEEPPPPQQQPEPEPEAPPLPSVFRDIKPVKKVKPVYPREAEDQHIQGRVKVRLSVDLDGNVTDVEVLLAEPPGVFDDAVLTAVKQYKFKRDGTRYRADQEIVFKLDD
jgi:protein TonB